MTISRATTLNQLLQSLREGELRLTKPTAVTSDKTLYMPNPPALERATRKNLDQRVVDLIAEGEEITVTDEVLVNNSLGLRVQFEEGV